jgi:polar amino acid transport system substrate-binding protein
MTCLVRRRAIAVTAAILLTLLAAGCAKTPGSTAAPSATAPTVDQSLHDRLPPDIIAAGVIRVAGGGSTYPPLTSFAEDGQTRVGLEPDLLAALSTVLGIRFETVGGEFTEHLDRVRKHDVDLAVDSLSDTAEREKQVDFVTYFSAGTSILVKRGNAEAITTLDHLCGRRVGIEHGSTQENLATRSQAQCGKRPIILRAYDENAEAVVQLRAGSLDAILLDYPVAAALSTEPKTRTYFQLASDTQFEPIPGGIVVAKDRRQLRDVIGDAMNSLIDSGVYRQIFERWGMSEAMVSKSVVNAASAPVN